MNEEDKLIKWLAIQSEVASDHGYKLWEEIKYFSWALHIVLAAVFILKFQFHVNEIILLIIWPILAIFLSIIAMYSIYKEGSDFEDVLLTVSKLEEVLKLTVYKKKGKDINNRYRYKSIRFWFIFYFFVLMFIGILEIVWMIPQIFSKEYIFVFIFGMIIGLFISPIIYSLLDKRENKKNDP